MHQKLLAWFNLCARRWVHTAFLGILAVAVAAGPPHAAAARQRPTVVSSQAQEAMHAALQDIQSAEVALKRIKKAGAPMDIVKAQGAHDASITRANLIFSQAAGRMIDVGSLRDAGWGWGRIAREYGVTNPAFLFDLDTGGTAVSRTGGSLSEMQ